MAYVLLIGNQFQPADDVLIEYYLKPKINNQSIRCNLNIHCINIYEYNPEELHNMFRGRGEEVCYFFTPGIKMQKGVDIGLSRTTKDGLWMATTGLVNIFHQRIHIGFRRTLVYWKGRIPVKTSWIMQEYALVSPPTPSQAAENDDDDDDADMKFGDWVLCKIYMAPQRLEMKKATRHHPYLSTPRKLSSSKERELPFLLIDPVKYNPYRLTQRKLPSSKEPQPPVAFTEQDDFLSMDLFASPIDQYWDSAGECRLLRDDYGPLSLSMDNKNFIGFDDITSKNPNGQQNLNIANPSQHLPGLNSFDMERLSELHISDLDDSMHLDEPI